MEKNYLGMSQFMLLSYLKRIVLRLSLMRKGIFEIDGNGISKRKEYHLSLYRIVSIKSTSVNLIPKSLTDCDFLFLEWSSITEFPADFLIDDNRLYIVIDQEYTHKLIQDLKVFLQRVLSNAKKLNVLVRINEKNALFGDDFILFFTNYSEVKLYFDLDPRLSIKTLKAQLFFHIAMFFEGLKKKSSMDFMEYFRLDSIFQTLRIGRREDIALPYTSLQTLPDSGDMVKYFRSALKSKKLRSEELQSSEVERNVTKVNPSSWEKVLILGWYGTETQGDKAILGEVLHFLRTESPEVRITLSSIYTVLSEQTNLELVHLEDAEIIPIHLCANKDFLKQFDAVVIGGGPLMESSSMRHLANVFTISNTLAIPRIVFGCGVGPIHSNKVEGYTRTILKYASAGFLRDNESKELADSIHHNNLGVACDPAMGFMVRWRKTHTEKTNRRGIACLLRANTNEFANDLSKENLREVNMTKASVFSLELNKISNILNEPIHLLHMNAPWIGGDDRVFNRYVAKQFNTSVDYQIVRDYFTLEEHIEALGDTKYTLAMRYHGHIFSIGLAIPFVSIDYTGKNGKVGSLMKRMGLNDLSVIWSEMGEEVLLKKFKFLETHYGEIRSILLREGDQLMELLHSVYRDKLNAVKF